jgi:hypothetical protein
MTTPQTLNFFKKFNVSALHQINHLEIRFGLYSIGKLTPGSIGPPLGSGAVPGVGAASGGSGTA